MRCRGLLVRRLVVARRWTSGVPESDWDFLDRRPSAEETRPSRKVDLDDPFSKLLLGDPKEQADMRTKWAEEKHMDFESLLKSMGEEGGDGEGDLDIGGDRDVNLRDSFSLPKHREGSFGEGRRSLGFRSEGSRGLGLIDAPSRATLGQVVRSFRISIEALPSETDENDIVLLIQDLTGAKPVSIEFYTGRGGKQKNAMVQFDSKETMDRVLTPGRLQFGIYVRAQRCPVHNAMTRVVQLFVSRLPSRSSTMEIEQMIRNELPTSMAVNSIDFVMDAEGHHRGMASLTFENHDVARAALDVLRVSEMAERGMQTRFAASKSIHTTESPYDAMLHNVRARMVATQEENLRLKAEMEVLTSKLNQALEKN